ncbi:GyrI-like domain-containing protein [Sporolactobacillus putidus]|uniref:Integron-associated effector binding protein domain-containing protein n=1 Tax=Sporolactobacillus putidus TaxID=492735 RepID=A0A917VZL3_9BACL|nr:effector binding domain-containing protein [Sporolactobacillus putidus]GGL43573.1 hypothetical protein GCM10007968_04320 [Sporolactobacillus putidus]
MLSLKLKKRQAFYICGYYKETSLETCEKELSKLWRDYDTQKEELFNAYGFKRDFYGLMWPSAHSGRYYYLIGIEGNDKIQAPKEAVCKCIPGANYAVGQVPAGMSAVDAWTDYYEKTLPDAGYTPNAEHGFNFEYYPDGSHKAYELWTPIH